MKVMEFCAWLRLVERPFRGVALVEAPLINAFAQGNCYPDRLDFWKPRFAISMAGA